MVVDESLSNTLTIDQAIQLGKDRGVQIGIVEHPGPGFPINTDADHDWPPAICNVIMLPVLPNVYTLSAAGLSTERLPMLPPSAPL